MVKSLKEFTALKKYLKDYKKSLIGASILVLACEFGYILTGYLNGLAVEAITSLALKKAILFLVSYLLIRLTVDGIFSAKAYQILRKIESILTRKLGYYTYRKALDLPAYAYEKVASGEVINRITSDTDTLSNSFLQLLQIFSSLLGSFILIFYIFFNSWVVGLEIVVFVAILALIIRKYNPIIKKLHKEKREEQDKFTSLVTESVRGVREIKTLGIKNNLMTDLTGIIRVIYNKSAQEIDKSTEFDLITNFLKAFLEVGVFITCIVLIYIGKGSITFFIAMTYYIYRYMWLIENINDFMGTYQRVTVSLGRVNEILENRLYQDEKFGEAQIKKPVGVLEFRNVSFSYPGEENILVNFNLKLEPNKKIAIVGKSGQGKSTLFNLITRVFDPNRGEILLDGVNIRELTEEELRKHISVIRQEPFIFNRTIKENFKLVDKKISLTKIRKYAKMAYLDDYIMTLPKKYDTILGEGGVNLSGGQKQRLAIARTLARESKVILFDEATSALDNDSQNYVKKAIDDLVKDHTVVIVAHRLSTIKDADIIYVVDKGKVVAKGKHEELLSLSKIYKNLYETEAKN